MPIIKPETRRLVKVIFALAPVALRYRSDRKEIKKTEGKILHAEKYASHAKKAVESFIELGPAFIKLGQLLSVRPDVLPQPYIDEFAKLQDEVPASSFDLVKPVIESEIGALDKIFDSFDQNAVVGASLGQVYKAIYQGKQVVVKVNRPGIRERVAIDTLVLRRLMPLAGRFIDSSLRFSLSSVIDQFSSTIQEEMDYSKEAANLKAIKRNLKGDKTVVVPNVFPEISKNKVLVLEEIQGIKVTDTKKLDQEHIDRKKLARNVARLYFKMLLSDDLFHADPHPGNISISSDSKIILYDYGMVGTLDEETRINLIRFYTALVDSDSQKIVQVMLELGVLQPDANRYVITRGVELALADMKGKKVEESEVKALMEVANRTIYQFPFKLPRNLVLYMRMLSILEGVCLALDPDFRFIKILGNLLEEEGLVEEAYMQEVKDQIKRLGTALDASIELAPMLKNYLSLQQQKELSVGKKKGHARGVLVGIGVFGSVLSSFFLDTDYGKVAFALSLALLAFGLVSSWDR